MAIIGFIGDIHGHFDAIPEIIKENPFVERWFQIGDLGGEYDNYPGFPTNFHFIQGNHENWEFIQSLKEIESSVFLPNGSIHKYNDTGSLYTVAAMGGNYSPKAFYNRSNSIYQNKSKHFTLEDFDKLYKNAMNVREVNILLTHEAPTPYFKFHSDVGIPEITQLALRINPDLHIFGHHHNFKVLTVNGLLSVCLDYGYKSYLLYDTKKKIIKGKKFKKL